MSIFPEGSKHVDREDGPVPVDLIQADSAGPTWRVHVETLPIKDYRRIFSKGKPEGGGGFRQNNATQDRTDKEYLTKVIGGWEGCTFTNWNALIKDGKTLEPPTGGKFSDEIEFTQDLMFYLYRNSWPVDVADPIFDAVKNGVDKQEEAEAEVKKS